MIHLLKEMIKTIFLLLVVAAMISGCVDQPSSGSQSEDGFLSEQNSISFFVTIPTTTTANAPIYLEILDDLSGINLNPGRFEMKPVTENVYTLQLPTPDHSIVRYRYVLGGNPETVEHSNEGEPVYYRVVDTSLENAAIFRDVVAAWTSIPTNIPSGRVTGEISDSITSEPVSGLIININGQQTKTDVNGRFSLEKLLPGKYLLTILSEDGRYAPFQQEAIIVPDAETPVVLSLKPRPTSLITFTVTPPENHPANAEIRIIGNISQLGNTFSEQPTGSSLVSRHAPLLQPGKDGTYSTSLELPAGLEFRYKYTIGTSFWNTERHPDGQSYSRQLTVPAQATTINETIARWEVNQQQPVRLQLTASDAGQSEEDLFIQFFSYTWTEPIRLWKHKEIQAWSYTLYSPLYLFPSIGYRLCMDELCNQIVEITDTDHSDSLSFPTDGSLQEIRHTILLPTSGSDLTTQQE